MFLDIPRRDLYEVDDVEDSFQCKWIVPFKESLEETSKYGLLFGGGGDMRFFFWGARSGMLWQWVNPYSVGRH